MKLLTAVATALAIALVAPGAASASSVEISGSSLRYRGGPEANSLFLSFSGGAWQVYDSVTVVLAAGPGCTNPEGDNTATCTGTVNYLDIATAGGRDYIGDTSFIAPFSGVSELSGGEGNDTIYGTAGSDNLNGGGGDDLMDGNGGDDFFYGGDGDNDRVSYGDATGPVKVDLTPGGDADGESGGAEGDDANRDGTVEGVVGSAHDDMLIGSASRDWILGLSGDDDIRGNGGDDVLSGGEDEDTIVGNGGGDTISGDGSFDSDGPSTHDVLDGGSEEDRVVYQWRFEPVRVDLSDGAGAGSEGENDSLTGFEHVTGGNGDDVLIGTSAQNLIDGGPGDDVLDGGGNNDGLDGEAGNDTVTYASRTGTITANLLFGSGPVGGGEGSEQDEFHNVENLTGGSGNDMFTGSVGRNVLRGGPGADTITGNAGADEIHGDAGQDAVDAGPGEDVLRLRDSELDQATCGDAFDVVVADPVDALTGCESAETGPAPAAPEELAAPPQPGPPANPGGGTPPPVTTAPDRVAPRITLGTLAAKLKRKPFLKGLPLTLSCDEACSWDVELRGSARSVRLARYEVILGSRALPSGTSARNVTLKPSKKLIGRAKKLTVQLRIVATDDAGNRTTLTKTLKVAP